MADQNSNEAVGQDPHAVKPDASEPRRQAGAAWRARIQRAREHAKKHPILLLFWQILVTAVGCAVVIAGIVMLVTPGPGWLTIFLGLAILGSEFAWARRLLVWTKKQVVSLAQRYRAWRKARAKAKG